MTNKKKKFITKVFTRDYLVNDLELPEDAVEDTVVDNSRWSIQHSIIFKDIDGKFYSTGYSVGATEMQDERPWEYENNITCYEVEQKEVMVKKWVGVEAQ